MSSAVKRPRGRPAIPKEVQRRRLIEAAFRVFERNRYERTSVADIVGEAGMSSRSFYDHFASKEDLVAEIVAEVGERLLGELSEVMTEMPLDVERNADLALGIFLEGLPVSAIDLERLGGDAGRRVGEVRRRIVQRLTNLTHTYLGRLLAKGLVARLPERAEVEIIMTGIEGMCLRYYSEGRRDELLEIRPLILRLLLTALG
ncbi:MAG TPA: helix-turn-helix domain-containing protein [Myxococcota bacterium]|nr:helix-turn-helix domain-containing protein [Myxococcota bacterium]